MKSKWFNDDFFSFSFFLIDFNNKIWLELMYDLYSKIRSKHWLMLMIDHTHTIFKSIELMMEIYWIYFQLNTFLFEFGQPKILIETFKCWNSLLKRTFQVNWQICINILFWKRANRNEMKKRRKKMNAEILYFLNPIRILFNEINQDPIALSTLIVTSPPKMTWF